MLKPRWITLIVLSTLTIVGVTSKVPAAPEGDDLIGDAKSGGEVYNLVCVACHGDRAQGNITFNAPKLVGQEPWYMERQLKNFKSGARGSDPRDVFGAQMRPMAMTLQGDQAIADVIAYIMSLSKATQ